LTKQGLGVTVRMQNAKRPLRLLMGRAMGLWEMAMGELTNSRLMPTNLIKARAIRARKMVRVLVASPLKAVLMGRVPRVVKTLEMVVVVRGPGMGLEPQVRVAAVHR
jgi:hypothetical protein